MPPLLYLSGYTIDLMRWVVMDENTQNRPASFERAYRACNLCHRYDKHVKYYKPKEDVPDKVHERSSHLMEIRDRANFEAMRALETDPICELARSALAACATCDYSSARIAELLKDGISKDNE